jgi:hypothetical protein
VPNVKVPAPQTSTCSRSEIQLASVENRMTSIISSIMMRSKSRLPTDSEVTSLSDLQRLVTQPFVISEHEVCFCSRYPRHNISSEAILSFPAFADGTMGSIQQSFNSTRGRCVCRSCNNLQVNPATAREFVVMSAEC